MCWARLKFYNHQVAFEPIRLYLVPWNDISCVKNEQDHLPGLTLAEAGKYTLEVFAPLAIRINESFDKGSHHKQNLMTALLLKGIFPQ